MSTHDNVQTSKDAYAAFGRVPQTNKTYTCEDAHLLTYQDGKMVRFQIFTDTAAIAAAFRGE